MEEEEAAEELRVGSRIAVLLERVEGGTLLVSLTCGRRSFSGVLLEGRPRGSGVCCVSPSLLKQDDPPSGSGVNQTCQDEDTAQPFLRVQSCPGLGTLPSKNTEVPLVPPQGTLLTCPPYFEGAPFPPPIWLRHTYNQWVPQPPPRTIKRTKRRLSRNRDSGRLTVSTIRLRPRQVLCEKCKNTLNAENDDKDVSVQTDLTFDIHNIDRTKPEEIEYDEIKPKKERKEVDPLCPELVPRSPVIKISFSTPQGKGEVVEIPSRVHGSVEPFCPKRIIQNGSGDQSKSRDCESIQETNCMEKSESGPVASIPKLKLTRPVHSDIDAPPSKMRLKPRRIRDGESVSVYKAELINELNMFESRKDSDSAAFCTHKSTERRFADLSSGSSGEDEDYKGFPHNKSGHGSLTLLMNYHKRNVDSSGLSLCSNDSLDESSKSSSSELTSLEMSDFLPCDDVSVSSSSKEGCKIVPPLTVRLHTKCVSKCVTEEGRTFVVGDIVWGKIHGFPWWPASILSISTSQKENGEPSWQEAKVSWFGSPTTSFLSVSKLSSFCEFFKMRFNRKKKGLYRQAITEAAIAVEHLAPDIRALLMQCET